MVTLILTSIPVTFIFWKTGITILVVVPHINEIKNLILGSILSDDKLLFWFGFTFWVQFSLRQQTLVSIVVQFVLTRKDQQFLPAKVGTHPTLLKCTSVVRFSLSLSFQLKNRQVSSGYMDLLTRGSQEIKEPHHAHLPPTSYPRLLGWGSHNPFHLCNWLHKCCFYFSLALFS